MSLLTASNPPAPAENGADAQPVIQLEGVSVRYRVPQERIPSLKEYAIRRLQRTVSYHDFWALHNVNLSVGRGEVLGIIGANGAGKSTLLKVVARVLRPTRGRARVRGRVAPLLELGAGFDPELTGRENVFLNGTLLGYTRGDVAARFDRIVEFAGLRDFIDAPLRTYSSGMLARLGFSVATDVTPEILIVDEVLAVGDAEFQQKSSERIQSFRESGTTILMVTHSLTAVQAMCTQAIWLDQGQLQFSGPADSVVRQYQAHNRAAEAERLAQSGGPDPSQRHGTGHIEITGVRLTDQWGTERTIFETGQAWVLHIDYEARGPVEAPVFGMAIHRQDGLHLTGPNTSFGGLALPTLTGRGTITYTVPALALLEGLYQVSVAVVNQQDTVVFDYHDRAYPFRVLNESQRVLERYGLVTLHGHWAQAEPKNQARQAGQPG